MRKRRERRERMVRKIVRRTDDVKLIIPNLFVLGI